MTTYTLDVSGNMKLTGNLYCEFYVDVDVSQNLFINKNNNSYINTVGGNAVQYFSNDQHVFYDVEHDALFRTGTDRTVTYNNQIFEKNVGIGTYDPSGALHVATGKSVFNNNVGIGTLDPSYNLHVVGTTLLSGNTTITNSSSPSYNTGTLILNKTVPSGVSSIVFPSQTNINISFDYGSIEYYDEVFGTNLNYFSNTFAEEQSCLFINCQNDGQGNPNIKDSIVIRPKGGLILDVGTYSNSMTQDLSGTIFMVPNNSNVCIGSMTQQPNYKLYVNGTSAITNNTNPGYSSGTLILNKTVSSGVSSIVFPSLSSVNDYGSIQYYDDVYGTNKNYFGQTVISESACLYIGSENDNDLLYPQFRDTTLIRPVGGLILDVGTYSNSMTQDLSGTIFMVPNNSNVCIGSMTQQPNYKLYVNGTSAITNSSSPSYNTGTLILNKTVPRGVSSIVFPSQTNINSDYGSIEYYDDVYGTNLNYFSNTSAEEQSCLFINCQNDGQQNPNIADSIVIRPKGGLILDVGTYSNSMTQDLSGTIFMVPNNSNISIGSMIKHPEYKLYVEGNIATSGLLGSDRLFSTGDISFGGSLNLNNTSSISLSQTELSYLNNASSNIQDQINNKTQANFEILSFNLGGNSSPVTGNQTLTQNTYGNTNYAVFTSLYYGWSGSGGTYNAEGTANAFNNIIITNRTSTYFSWLLTKSQGNNVNIYLVFLVVYGLSGAASIPVSY